MKLGNSIYFLEQNLCSCSSGWVRVKTNGVDYMKFVDQETSNTISDSDCDKRFLKTFYKK